MEVNRANKRAWKWSFHDDAKDRYPFYIIQNINIEQYLSKV